MVSDYPVQFDVDFPSRPLDRISTAFRLLVAIPIVIVLSMLTGATFGDDDHARNVRPVLPRLARGRAGHRRGQRGRALAGRRAAQARQHRQANPPPAPRSPRRCSWATPA